VPRIRCYKRPMTTVAAPRRTLGRTDLQVFPLCLGGNVFGWTADEERSFAVLDAYVAAGGNFIDTADQYSNWVPGHQGGESETILGRWLRARGNRDEIVLATKVGAVGLGNPGGLTAESIDRRVEGCLTRLGVDTIDLLYAHHDDPGTPLEETMGAFDALVRAGTVRWLGGSNYVPDRLRAALRTAEDAGGARFEVLQARYNILERGLYEDELRGICADEGLACVPYWTLAKGFLTGKYRSRDTSGEQFSDRATRHNVLEFMDERSTRILDVLAEIAAERETTIAAVTLAWTAAQPTIVAPIASARTVGQLTDLLPMATVELSDSELDRLRDASASAPAA
jgi:aryl-alcohol dehydrogenase-like predicted oxidoreductase